MGQNVLSKPRLADRHGPATGFRSASDAGGRRGTGEESSGCEEETPGDPEALLLTGHPPLPGMKMPSLVYKTEQACGSLRPIIPFMNNSRVVFEMIRPFFRGPLITDQT